MKKLLVLALSVGSVSAADISNLNQDNERGVTVRLEVAEVASAVDAPVLNPHIVDFREQRIAPDVGQMHQLGAIAYIELYCPGHKKRSWASGTRFCQEGCQPRVIHN